MHRHAACLLVVLPAVATLSAQRNPARLGPGDTELSLRHGSRDRTYIVHVPPGGSGPRPLLVAFHGGGGNARGYQDYAGLDAVADREGFVVAYPNGTGLLGSLLLTFNAGNNCCGSARRQEVDDVGFAVAVIEDVSRRTNIDRRRVYATGHSNGSMMSYRLAAERADLIAAIAPVAGAMSLDRFDPSNPVPVMHIHSVDDPRALYGGGLGPPFPGTNSRVDHAPVEAGLALWIARNGCPTEPVIAEERQGARGTRDAGQTATKLVHGPCETGADVILWKLTGAGHGWPGGASPMAERLIGPRTNIVNAAEEVWAFVSQYPRAAPRRESR